MIRLHVTYRRPIPAIEVSGSDFAHFYLMCSLSSQDRNITCRWGGTSASGCLHYYEHSTNTVPYCFRVHTSQTEDVDDVSISSILQMICSDLRTIVACSRMSDKDAEDISYVLSRYWNRVDINRIPEQDMNVFVARNSASQPWWLALKRKYDMWTGSLCPVRDVKGQFPQM